MLLFILGGGVDDDWDQNVPQDDQDEGAEDELELDEPPPHHPLHVVAPPLKLLRPRAKLLALVLHRVHRLRVIQHLVDVPLHDRLDLVHLRPHRGDLVHLPQVLEPHARLSQERHLLGVLPILCRPRHPLWRDAVVNLFSNLLQQLERGPPRVVRRGDDRNDIHLPGREV